MSGDRIFYRSGYKYQLAQRYVVQTAVKPDAPIVADFLELDEDGVLTVRAGYAWDGASGPAIDTATFLRGSLVHDALYQLMALHGLDRARWRKVADEELIRVCAEDGMSWLRRQWVYAAVRAFGRGTKDQQPRVERAP